MESALLGDQYREESVRTITFTHLYVLKRDEFESLLKVMTNHDNNRNGNSDSVPQSPHLSPPRMSPRMSFNEKPRLSNPSLLSTESQRQITLRIARKSLLRESQETIEVSPDHPAAEEFELNIGHKGDIREQLGSWKAPSPRSCNMNSERYDAVMAQMRKSYESELKMKTKVSRFFGSMDEAPPQKPRCTHCCMKLKCLKCIDLKAIFHPQSRFIKCWTLVHFLLVLYSFLVLPFRASFSIEVYRDWERHDNVAFTNWLTIDIIMDVFWCCDFYLRAQHFGHSVSRGSLKYISYNPNEIWLKYKEHHKMRYDLVSIVPIEYVLCFSGVVPMQYFSVIRCRLLLKWLCYLDEWKSFLLDALEGMLSLNVLRLIVLFTKIVIFGHILACIWYFIGFCTDETLATLAEGRDLSEFKVWFDYDELHFSTQFRKYIRSLYWSFITVTTTGYGDIRGFSVAESFYAGSCVFCGGMV